MPGGDRLFKFLAGLMVRRFHGTITIRFQEGKATHVTAESRRTWEYRHLPASLAVGDAEPGGQQVHMLDGDAR